MNPLQESIKPKFNLIIDTKAKRLMVHDIQTGEYLGDVNCAESCFMDIAHPPYHSTIEIGDYANLNGALVHLIETGMKGKRLFNEDDFLNKLDAEIAKDNDI